MEPRKASDVNGNEIFRIKPVSGPWNVPPSRGCHRSALSLADPFQERDSDVEGREMYR
jgi:hypothetical protein